MIGIGFILMLALNFSSSHIPCLPGQCVGVARYDCADYTANFVTELRTYNITAYPILGWFNHRYHAWVGVELNGRFYNIEPETGKIVYPSPNFSQSYYYNGRRGVVRGVV